MAELVTLELPEAVIDVIVDRVLERVLERLGGQGSSGPAWFTVAGAAEYLGVSETHVRRLMRSGAIAFSQEAVGCRITLARRDLDAYLAERRQGAE